MEGRLRWSLTVKADRILLLDMLVGDWLQLINTGQFLKSMMHILPATHVKNRFGEILKHIYSHGDHIVVEKSGIPVAAIVPISVYSRIEEEHKEGDHEIAERISIAAEAATSRWNLQKKSKCSLEKEEEVKQSENKS